MKIKFIFLGKKKSHETSSLVDNYLLRLKKYVKCDIVFFDNNNELKLINKFKPNDYVIILDELGKSFSSIQFSNLLIKSISNYSTIFLIVGDAYGVSEKILNKSNLKISISNMTFPHLIARLVLLEQTYRAFTILNNHPYHHE